MAHLRPGHAAAEGLDPRRSPFLIIDGKHALQGEGWTDRRMARLVLKALMPAGLADLRQ